MTRDVITLPTWRLVILSTSHITEDDDRLLAYAVRLSDTKRTAKVEPSAQDYPGELIVSASPYLYGYYIPITWEDTEWERQYPLLLEAGYSKAFCAILYLCITQNIALLQLDRDADLILHGLPVFDR